MSHLQQLTQTDSQALKQEICGLVKKKKNVNFTIKIVIYLHVWQLSNVLQYSYSKRCIIQLNVIQLITEFTWIMGKIKCFIDESFILENSNITHFTLLMSKIRVSNIMESRITDHKDSPVFKNLVDLLKTKAWPEENFEDFVVT